MCSEPIFLSPRRKKRSSVAQKTPVLPSNCSFLLLPNCCLHLSSVHQCSLLIFCLLKWLERFFLHLLTLLRACKWGDLAFKRLNLERSDIREPLGLSSSLLAHHLSVRNDSSNVPSGHQGLVTFSGARFVCQDQKRRCSLQHWSVCSPRATLGLQQRSWGVTSVSAIWIYLLLLPFISLRSGWSAAGATHWTPWVLLSGRPTQSPVASAAITMSLQRVINSQG